MNIPVLGEMLRGVRPQTMASLESPAIYGAALALVVMLGRGSLVDSQESEARMSAIIQAQEVSRWYGIVMGLNNVTFEIAPGLTGLVGPERRRQEHADSDHHGSTSAQFRAPHRVRGRSVEQPGGPAPDRLLPRRRSRSPGTAPAGLAERVGPAFGRPGSGSAGPLCRDAG